MNLNVYDNMRAMDIKLPPPPGLGGVYTQAREFGENLCYISGCGPNIDGGEQFSGKLGGIYTIEEGQQAARMAALNSLAVLEKNIGDLNRVKRIAKLLCFVASENDFYKQPTVANAASQLFIDVFGEEIGKGARSAIGVNALPDNIPFEIELLIELQP